MAQMAYAVSASEALFEFELLVALTLQPVMPLKMELKTCMADGLALLPTGTVVVKPPEIIFNPAGHIAVAVPLACFKSVSGLPVM